MTIFAQTIFVVLVLGVPGCSPHEEFDRALLSSNNEEISDLKILVTKHAVPHKDTAPENGKEGLSYRSVDQQRSNPCGKN